MILIEVPELLFDMVEKLREREVKPLEHQIAEVMKDRYRCLSDSHTLILSATLLRRNMDGMTKKQIKESLTDLIEGRVHD